MLKSIRLRLLIWTALMLVAIVAGFASYVYWSAEQAAWRQVDVRLDGATRYLEAAIRPFPVREFLRLTPFQPPVGSPGNREGVLRGGATMPPEGPASLGPQRDFFEKRPQGDGPPPDKQGNDKRGYEKRPQPEGDKRSPVEGDKRGERRGFDAERRQNMLREAERMKRDLGFRRPADSDDPRPPLFFTIFRFDGSVFKSVDDPITNREHSNLEIRLNDRTDLVFYNSAGYRLALSRGPERSLILVGVSLDQDRQTLQTLFWQLIGSGTLAVTFGLLGSWFIASRIVKPLKTISTTASKLSATHLQERIDTSKVETELVEVASVLNETFDRLEAAFERQSRFTADAGHELRTPLAVLHTNLELALSRPRKEEEFREIIEYCLISSSKMRSLIDALLMLARADAGQLQANFTSLDLRSVIQNSVSQHQSKAKGLQLTADVPNKPVLMQGDATLLGMVLTNLLQNAIRHTPPSGDIRVNLIVEGDTATLSVNDTGTGIPADALPHLFERFYRVDASRNRHTGGHGLGLAICKSLLDVHHGSIRCESEVGKGTRFIITLPLK
jgi:two-component system OmpR family sensor kinase